MGIDDPGVLNTNPIDSSSVPACPIACGAASWGPRNPAAAPRDPGNRPRVPAPDAAPNGARPADSPTGGTGRAQPQSRHGSPESKHVQFCARCSPKLLIPQQLKQAKILRRMRRKLDCEPANTQLDPPITQLDDSGTAATQVPRTADARRDPSATTGTGNVPGGTPMTHQIGTLTVDQSGTGRLQQTVEGVQVQDVVGQAIVLYSSSASANTPLPPNLDAAADPNADPRSTPADRARAEYGDTGNRRPRIAMWLRPPTG